MAAYRRYAPPISLGEANPDMNRLRIPVMINSSFLSSKVSFSFFFEFGMLFRLLHSCIGAANFEKYPTGFRV